MKDLSQSEELRRKRAQAVKTAWVLGIIAASIFAAFIGSAILGR
jgi:hypothetical protein